MGLPLISLENPEDLSISPESSSSSATSTTMGIRPLSSGMPLSCMGTAARSEMSSVTTSSTGCSSPSCRLPMIRMAAIMNM